ncbi:alpha/beta hydrolase [Stackebrandtia nassauensis]|uniref:DUF1023 domain-containing protein n=1 Tax=Stackebrandtia nassauensis (strain DSM 44728 / CIP 108903 / NRRL B-16338 / NBRC 102104 / LLR-40K-21) TaxID=446470 RepID=D3Q6Y1_STANL|nr:alpha/beta hydrolase [Stackebrandtia nassauensis]ADD40380.1 protein of unknown function DUF1023 [Stackebrandtia nassauensis DSM 44728]
MVTVSELENARPEQLEGSARAARKVSVDLGEHINRTSRAWSALQATWYGPDAHTAGANLHHHRLDLTQARLAYGRIDSALSDFAGELRQAQKLLKSALARADGIHATVTDDGTVRVSDEVMKGKSSAERANIKAQLKTIADDIAKARTRAVTADRQAVAQLTGVSMPDGPDIDATPLLKDVPTDPQLVKKWWDGLNPDQRVALITADPKRIGGLDGVPAIDRDQANRLYLDNEQEQLAARKRAAQARIAEIQRLGDQGKGSPALLSEALELQKKIAGFDEKAKQLNHFEEKLNESDPRSSTERRFLLKFDPAGDGRAIVAVGNPDTADNVATFVPGTGTTIADDTNLFNRGAIMQSDATLRDPTATTSVITWLDYEAPSFVSFGPEPGPATTGSAETATDLAQFQNSLRFTHEGPRSRNTILGHSYGATVVGYVADRQGLDVDNIVFVASPGSGQGLAGDAGDFRKGLDKDNRLRVPTVFATRAENDPIQAVSGAGGGLAGTNGPDPTEEGFGAKVFRSDPGTTLLPRPQGDNRGEWGYGGAHSDYWNGPNNPESIYERPQVNEARDNFSRIITGMDDQVTVDTPTVHRGRIAY